MKDLDKYPAYILAGGRSRRFGRDKARALIDENTTVLQATIEPLDGLFSSWTVVADEVDKYADLGFRTIADGEPHRGPLGGILRACEDAQGEYFFVCSCDRIGLRPAWVDRLAAELSKHPSAVTFRSETRREPLFGFYGSHLEASIREFLDAGQRAAWHFLEEIDARAIEAPSGWSDTIGVNTPKALQRAASLRRQSP